MTAVQPKANICAPTGRKPICAAVCVHMCHKQAGQILTLGVPGTLYHAQKLSYFNCVVLNA